MTPVSFLEEQNAVSTASTRRVTKTQLRVRKNVKTTLVTTFRNKGR